ncbi:MAG TPA: copper oxidase [Pyrinomonadaceae bacterium]|nr:copper oxidase [Pyrinomonadaceae bacterium]
MSDSRRDFLKKSGLLGAGMLAGGGMVSAQHQGHIHPQPEPAKKETPKKPPVRREAPARRFEKPVETRPNVPVETPDVPKLPFTLDNGVKVFHLTAEVVKTQLLPGREMYGWGYNGSVPGPMIEVNEGDRVRIIHHNKLPEPTTIHWHGLEVPPEMDGVPFISQPMIEPGASFTYEFTLNQHGTFFYHSHGAMQEMMGMIGLFVIHPKTPNTPYCHRDFGLILQEWALLPNNPVPNSMAMEFNWLTINGKAGPATTPMLVRQGERVRLRVVNLGMDHHPMHIHGHQFFVTGTEGGRIPETAWYPGNTVLVGVAQARDVEFDAVHVGNWMFHCHLPHHMMNQMISMVGPMSQAGHGTQTGGGMEEGMGIVRQGHALSEDMAPKFGRGMGESTQQERNTSNIVGPTQQQQHQGHQMNAQDEAEKKRVPGYPQDMMMIMDKEVAKPHTYGLPPGWTASMMGMMTLVRVLPPKEYDEIQRRIREGIVEAPTPGHKHD